MSPYSPSTESIASRPLSGDADWWRLRGLLVETVPLTPPCFNWDVRRLDGKRFYDPTPDQNLRWQTQVQLWESTDGRLAGAVNHEGRGDAHIQIHPDFRFLEEEMIAWAEAELAAPTADGSHRTIEMVVYEYDVHRQRLLARHGWERTPEWGYTRHMRLRAWPLVQPEMAEGYTLRTTEPEDLADCRQVAALLNAAFNRTFHNAEEYQTFARLAPCFRRDLDLVAVAPDGEFAAYVGVPYDDANRRGIFEPVCTHPNHRRKGLAQALMHEGLLRLRTLGAVDATVDTGEMEAANALYTSIGFTEAYKGYSWRKTL
jgi:ribosomal protein S18 acetylase RimI-like enzyme